MERREMNKREIATLEKALEKVIEKNFENRLVVLNIRRRRSELTNFIYFTTYLKNNFSASLLS